MQRREFLNGLAAIAAMATLPAPAEAHFIGVDLGEAEQRILLYINGLPCNTITIECSDDGEMWDIISCHQKGEMLYVDQLETGKHYRFSIQQGDCELYATDFQLLSDQRVSEPVEGKLERLLRWGDCRSTKKDSDSRVGDDGPTLITPAKAQARRSFASYHW